MAYRESQHELVVTGLVWNFLIGNIHFSKITQTWPKIRRLRELPILHPNGI